jgi:hypothetical protein
MTLGFSFSYFSPSPDVGISGNSGNLQCSLKSDIDGAITQELGGAGRLGERT